MWGFKVEPRLAIRALKSACTARFGHISTYVGCLSTVTRGLVLLEILIYELLTHVLAVSQFVGFKCSAFATVWHWILKSKSVYWVLYGTSRACEKAADQPASQVRADAVSRLPTHVTLL